MCSLLMLSLLPQLIISSHTILFITTICHLKKLWMKIKTWKLTDLSTQVVSALWWHVNRLSHMSDCLYLIIIKLPLLFVCFTVGLPFINVWTLGVYRYWKFYRLTPLILIFTNHLKLNIVYSIFEDEYVFILFSLYIQVYIDIGQFEDKYRLIMVNFSILRKDWYWYLR